MSGSGGGGGYEFQARVIAFVEAHILSSARLGWPELEKSPSVPLAVVVETGGPGDDLRITFAESALTVEVQVKRGLKNDFRLDEAIDKLIPGLALQSAFLGVLAVDPTSSNSITAELRSDLTRIAQGLTDGLHKITTDVIDRIAAAGISDPYSAAAHLSVVVLDLEEPSSHGAQLACLRLAAVISDPSRAEITWGDLIADAMSLIRNRGRRDGISLVRYLSSRSTQFSDNCPSTALGRFMEWQVESTAEFYLPGIGKGLSIETAWAGLEVLTVERQSAAAAELLATLDSYHRDSDILQNHRRRYAAKDIANLGRRVVIIGPAGAGKTTLCRKVSHDLAQAGEVAFHVRLPLVAKRMANGESIDEALAASALDGFTGRADEVARAIGTPDWLVADGLDECGAAQDLVSEAITRWSTAHEATRVIVTTRSLGYDPARFRAWKHAGLLPLDSHHISVYARQIIIAAVDGEAEADIHAKAFEAAINTNRTASLAVRSPLLLGFLVQIHLSGTAPAQQRAGLFQQILQLWRSRTDRPYVQTLDEPIATRSLDIVAWQLQASYAQGGLLTEQAIVDELGTHLASELRLQCLEAKVMATKCIAFWIERGVLEHVRAGEHHTYLFAHRSLGEFAAARYAADLDEAARLEWLDSAVADQRWHEVVVLSAGVNSADWLVGHLLARDETGGVVSTEALLAASAATEAQSLSKPVVDGLGQQLAIRLASPVPHIAYEAARAYEDLAKRLSAVVATVAGPLVYSEQIWTRLASLRLLLNTQDASIDPVEVESCLSAPPRSMAATGFGIEMSDAWVFWAEISVKALQYLHRVGRDEQALKLLKYMFEKGEHNGHSIGGLLSLSRELGHPELIDAYKAKWSAMPTLGAGHDLVAGHRALFASLQRVSSPLETLDTQPRRLENVAKVAECLDLPHLMVWDMTAVDAPGTQAAANAVLLGTIAAAGLDPRVVAAEAARGLEVLDEDDRLDWDQLAPSTTVTPEWQRAKELKLRTRDLVAALNHPSRGIAGGAARLLAANVGDEDSRALLENVLENGSDQAMQMVAGIADDVWQSDAIDRLLSRLDANITIGCRWILRCLPLLPAGQNDGRVRAVLIRFLTADDYRVAFAAAETLLTLDSTDTQPAEIQSIRRAYEHWSKNGSLCERCQTDTTEGYCPVCHAAPDTPRAPLLRLLSVAAAITTRELVTLACDAAPQVSEVARKDLTARLPLEIGALRQMVEDLAERKIDRRLVLVIVDLPQDTLATVKDGLLQLIERADGKMRAILVRSLGTGWLQRDLAIERAQLELSGHDPHVRDAAVSALRMLQRGTQSQPPVDLSRHGQQVSRQPGPKSLLNIAATTVHMEVRIG